MKPNPLFILPLLGVAGVLSTSAQELTGSLTAHGSYKPEIRTHNRISGLPPRLNTEVPEGSLPLSFGGVPVNIIPSLSAMLASDKGLELPAAHRGYLEALSGSYLNSSVSAGYRFIDRPDFTLGAYLQHNSSSLYRPDTDVPTEEEPARKKRYDETIGVYASYRVGDAGLLSADAAYHLGYFNYYSSVVSPAGEPASAPSQTLNDFQLKAQWKMTRKSAGLFADGDAVYRYFGYRRFYMPFPDGAAYKTPKENDLTLHTSVGYVTEESGTISLDATARMLFYGNKDWRDEASTFVEENPFDTPFRAPAGLVDNALGNYGIAGLTPAYSYVAGNWSLRAGVRVDLSWGLSDIFNPWDNKGFSSVYFSPDVAVSYSASKATVYMKAGGGVTPVTLASRSEQDCYQSPVLESIMPVYRPIEATLGLKLGDFNGFSAGVHATYAIADNTPMSGWYAYWMHGADPVAGQGFEAMTMLSLKGFSVGAEMAYKLGSMLSVNGALDYQRQSGKDGYFNGLDRPRWVASAEATVSPTEGLSIGVGYTYRGVRSLYLGRAGAPRQGESATLADHNFDDTHKVLSFRLPDIYDLSARVSYTLKGRYTFSARVDNILQCDDRLIPVMPTEGLSVSGGVSILF